ncbi:flavodoxin [Companilactobacillus jidongensis]|uniref:flavodoxin n=1 Tax=Companilactobacillus jidongensis TaxID=2486006 RepID=UPI0013DDE702|nr:flavodoxin [Companilactobacillus jidongensis]
MKSIVIYFSESGNTKKAAQFIAQETHSDIDELKPTKPYPDNYDRLVEVSGDEIDNNIHPAIDKDFNFSDYNVIYLGYPTWYHQTPMIINSFFDTYDLSNKTIIPFTTTYSSEFDESKPFIEKISATRNVKLATGFRANSDTEIKKYLTK